MKNESDVDIAIVGMGCRFPQARDTRQFWQNLIDGKSAISSVPEHRWSDVALARTFRAGFVDDVECFDAAFFKISPREAEFMDPQQRMLLEVLWHTLEDACIPPAALAGRNVGVFMGVCNDDYADLVAEHDLLEQGLYGSTGTSASILSNRVSFLFDFRGPSVTIDTACSSSLVAVHLATKAIRAGECELALAGGSNICWTSSRFLAFGKAGMLAKDGVCKTFDAQANGYVRGEGAGAILLRPLSDALRDGNHVYGIVKGGAINHGGKTRGLTVTSPGQQRQLLIDAYRDAGVHPDTVGYIEVHGTGTSLGDPIEFLGLKQAFEALRKDETLRAGLVEGARAVPCALGAVKTNIGHLEAAAGIAGLIKVLLAFEHRTIPANLNFNKLNPRIDLAGTSFCLPTSARDWPEADGHSPRRAGVSAFGYGGAYAHVVVEEYTAPPSPEKAPTESAPAMIVLSARTAEALREQARALLSAVERGAYTDSHLADMAHALQTGREAMEHRLAISVARVDALAAKLKAFVDGRTDVPDLWCGEVRRDKDMLTLFSADEELQEAVGKWILRGKHAKLLALWVKGLALDWQRLHGDRRFSHVFLPGYPFARERHWLPIGEARAAEPARLHPLVHRNTSTLGEVRFTSQFTGQEFFLADHVVKGQRVLPGVAYLELARKAVEEALPGARANAAIELRHVVWAQPIVVGAEPVRVDIVLRAEDGGAIAFEVHGSGSNEAGRPVVHSRGYAHVIEAVEAPRVDLQAYTARCSGESLEGPACYAAFEAAGFRYGPAYRGLSNVRRGVDADGTRFALARLVLPPSVAQGRDAYVLHPSLLDSALQGIIGLNGGGSLSVPFALDAVRIFGPCPAEAYALVREARSGEGVQKVSLDLCDLHGTVFASLMGYSTRVYQERGAALLERRWHRAPLASGASRDADFAQRWVLLDAAFEKELPRLTGVEAVLLRRERGAGAAEEFTALAEQAFTVVRGILRQAPKGDVLVQVVLPRHAGGYEETLSAISGLFESARQENPKFAGQVLALGDELQGDLVALLQENARARGDAEIRYEAGERYTPVLERLVAPRADGSPWKDDGVYLVTGGTGALGLVLAREITHRAKGATLIVTGRSEPGAGKLAVLESLRTGGAKIEYRSMDVCDAAAVKACVEAIRAQHGRLDGVVHTAGTLRDGFLLKKTEDEWRDVLAPKVRGLVNLDEATASLPLDLFVIFSSISGVFGQLGQTDYAAANAFMDRYAEYRSGLVEAGARQGRTISIDWPIWESGGMQMDAAAMQKLRERFGVTPLTTERGLEALHGAIAAGRPQVVVFPGDVEKLRTRAPVSEVAVRDVKPVEVKRPGVEIGTDALRAKAARYIRKALSSRLKLPEERIELDAPLEKYGIDSVMVMELTSELEKSFGPLSKTLFFEYQDIESVTVYFVESHRERLLELLGLGEVRTVAPAVREREVPPVARPVDVEPVRAKAAEAQAEPVDGIAIIGTSGRYPRANDLEEYWENLKAGRDCITEVPKDRWDHELYFDSEKGKPGKAYSKWGGFIDGVDQFEPLFFNISPREAQFIDPQERLFLQCVYETLEDAGYTRESLRGRRDGGLGGNVGVFVGVMYLEYQLYGAESQVSGEGYSLNGNPSSIANRVSYFCDFHGPSIALDTMCSSSLTAIHLACESLKHGGCELAIAGGVNVTIHPNKYLSLSQGQFASSKGRCESFGRGGDGYVPAEGVGAVLLKPLRRAIEDGDHIYGVVKGTSINHGGKTNGYTVPNPNAQGHLIARAFENAKVDVRAISYIEAHGTGTSLGDPIEIAGLNKAFRLHTEDNQFCAIGSAKSNIGHAESAAGIAGVAKVLLQLKYGTLVPSLHSETLNPHIDFEKSPFFVQRELAPWHRPRLTRGGESREYPRIAGISSFGAGGANAHVLIEEYVPLPVSREERAHQGDEHMMVLSARTADALRGRASRLLRSIERNGFADGDLADMAYTLQTGREAMDHRLALTVRHIEELVGKLRAYEQGRDVEGLWTGEVRRDKESLGADDDLQETVARWVERREYEKLLSAWVKGLSLDWQQFYAGRKPRRVSLPTYPFSKDRYWVPGKAKGKQAAGAVVAVSSSEVTVRPTPAPRVASRPIEAAPRPALNVLQPLEASVGPRAGSRVEAKPSISLSPLAVEPAVAVPVPMPAPAASPLARSGVPAETLAADLTTSLAEALYMDRAGVDPDRAFVDLGLDSIVGVEWTRAINKSYGLSLPATCLYDHPTIRRLVEYLSPMLVGTGVVAAQEPAPLPAPRGAGDPAKARQMLEEDLTGSLAEVLYTDRSEIDHDKPFVDLGLDSVVGVEWTRAINQKYGLSLPATSLYDHSSIRRLAEYLVKDLGVRLGGGSEADLPAIAPAPAVMSSPLVVSAPAVVSAPVVASAPAAVTDTSAAVRQEGIAVIGMSGAFPKAKDLDSFWKNLAAGRDCVSEVPAHRWSNDRYYDPNPEAPGKSYSKWMGELEEMDRFDPLFFNISPVEAQWMDPQQRLFLEHSWSCLESAGIQPRSLWGTRCGVYVGCVHGDYARATEDSLLTAQGMLGGSSSILPARISYFLNLKGPCLAIDTSCSSSLVSVAEACDGLVLGRSDLALAGGVMTMSGPYTHIVTSKAGMLSPRGRCFTFDGRADGFVPCEGVGVVLLKRLADAVRDGDFVHGVIRGWAINQDGKTNGITAPSASSQTALQKHVYDSFGIHPESISLVEAHGTGTKLGDPIEVQALTDSFRAYTSKTRYCALGSVKSNIGHPLAAAGIAGLLKVLLALRHRQLPPTIHFSTLNEHITVEGTPFFVNTELRPWETPSDQPRRAAISAFGFSGTNAHMVVEEHRAPVRAAANVSGAPAVVVLSAKTPERLRAYAEKLRAWVAEQSAIDVASLAYTLQMGRESMDCRLAFVAGTREQIHDALDAFARGHEAAGVFTGRAVRGRENTPLGAGEAPATLAESWASGLPVDWDAYHGSRKPGRLDLPTYPFERERHWLPTKDERTADVLLLERRWDVVPAEGGSSDDGFAQRWLLVEPAIERAASLLEARRPGLRWEVLRGARGTVAERFEAHVEQSFERVQEILRSAPKGDVLLQIVLAADGAASSPFAGLSGLLKSASRENPSLVTQLVQLDASLSAEAMADRIERNAALSEDREVHEDGGVRRVAHFGEIPTSSQSTRPWKDGGVYLMTGGAGGLGRLFAEEISERADNVTLVVTGRSALTGDRLAMFESLKAHVERHGGAIEYRAMDVSDGVAVKREIGRLLERHGRLNGLIHAAGITRDGFIVRKRKDEIRSVLSPKVDGLIHLDEATANLPLDFFVLFSSVAGALGNIGQTDYASANAFMDAFAVRRDTLVAQGARRGHTISIGWPLWTGGGMQVDEARSRELREAGLTPLGKVEGVEAFYRALASKRPHVVVLAGELDALRASLRPKARAKLPVARASIDPQVLADKTLRRLKGLFGEVTRLATNRVDVDEPFESYGIDSILITQLNQELSKTFGEISKTLWFEYQTLSSLAGYLSSHHPETCMRWTGAAPVETVAPSHAAPVDARANVPRVSSEREPVAIIGLSGRYPLAGDVSAYWENLKSGRDCVREIPAERWSLDGFYQPDIDQALALGKSYGKWGGFLDDFAQFDPLFFSISPREAMIIDPQERLFIECAWSVLEDAGYTRDRLASRHQSKVGVFVGITKTGFELYGPEMRRRDPQSHPHTSFGSVANRVSYLLNLRGPSMPIDTMCSASLTAIHEACEHLARGECELAIAGGVNLYLHPSSYVGLSAQRMLSPTGRCRSFGAGGDGFVPGEGVGAVLLKPLRGAVDDGDHIYAVIKGSSINHGGKTNGYTVPSPTAQRELIAAALKAAGVDARTVGYVEAHGTGTELGDPIEMTGLTQAFREHTQDNQFCAIGSVKSNIGHCESAAGIAGVTKILLQLKHRTLVPTLHATEPNPLIDFAQSPFRVQLELGPWQRMTHSRDGREQEYPRTAAISSFGAGGANAHVIIEEYVETRQVANLGAGADPAMVLLSARTADALRRQVRQLREAIAHGSFQHGDLADIAYTLQTGREAMDHRLAFTATDLGELSRKLAALEAGSGDIDELWQGEVRRDKETLGLFSAEEDLQETVGRWFARGKYEKLLPLWVKGLAIDWEPLWSGRRARRLSLPTYPFERETYWIAESGAATDSTSPAGVRLHPLVHENTSTLYEQRFTSSFTGTEFFFADHVVNGQRVLPGVAYLEMARRAVAEALQLEGHGIALSHVVWAQPIVQTTEPVRVHVALQAEENGTVRYEIYEENGARVIHSQGYAQALDALNEPNDRLDVPRFRAACEGPVQDAGACYAAFDAMGMHYGPAHRALLDVRSGVDADGVRFALARLAVPSSAGRDAYVLHPSLLDGALQATIGLNGGGELSLPFALDEIRVFGPCPSEAYAVVRDVGGAEGVRKLDVDLCDEHGAVFVRLRGYASRALQVGADLLGRSWQRNALAGGSSEAAAQATGHWVLVDGAYAQHLPRLKARWPGVHASSLGGNGAGMAARFGAAVESVFAAVGAILRERPQSEVLLQVVLGRDAETLEAVSGILKSARQENPKLLGQVLSLDVDSAEALVARLEENASAREDAEIRYEGTERYTPVLERLNAPGEAIPWKEGGVYLITGGAGGLGRIFAEEIAKRVANAKVIRTGRSERADVAGYRKLDVSNAEEVRALIQEIVREHGRLDGILHSAGVLEDGYVVKKTAEAWRRVLTPKVEGLIHLDEATAELDLDFVVAFSSTAAVFGNAGQSDYAAANGFMDRYMEYRNGLVGEGKRRGKSLSINWPYWENGGMQVDGAILQQYREVYGVAPLDTKQGLLAFYRAMSSGRSQVIAFSGDSQKWRARFAPVTKAKPSAAAAAYVESDAIEAKAVQYFRKLLSANLRVPLERIEADAPLDKYGIDSVRVMELTTELEKSFGPLSKTLFFEYQDIATLSRHFVEAHRARLVEVLGITGTPERVSAPAAAPPSAIVPQPRFRASSRRASASVDSEWADVAIIGVSGRYPQAEDLTAYWDNLKSGRDCITEVPADRWDHGAYFDAEKGKPGKSYSKWGGFIDGVDLFDPLFFSISPRDAQLMDPQERLFLQCAYETIEDAGYTREALKELRAGGLPGNVGVFVGVMYEEYQLYGAQAQAFGRGYALSGNPSSIANRVSYFFNFHGPSMALDTMCSSSLTAIHLACHSLMRGECEVAVAGGVNVSIHPNKYVALSQGQFASSKGRCESFGEGGDGYVPAEGVGAVLLKPLQRAIDEGDHIYAVIKGTSINHGGKTNGYTVPNPNAQAQVIAQALKTAKVDARTVSYIEAHGTGTSLGDPIEVAGLNKAFEAHTSERQFCALGSAKSNIGHAESAAGIAGVTKVLLQMKHAALVPSLHSETLNPHIDFAKSPFYVQRELAPWQRPLLTRDGQKREYRRIAGISSFGAGGANAHVILEEYVPEVRPKAAERAPSDAHPAILVLSTKSADGLRQQASRLRHAMVREAFTDADLPDIAFTLQVGRELMEHRLAFTAVRIQDAIDKLGAYEEGREGIDGFWCGEIRRDKEALGLFTDDEELQEAVGKWIERRKYAKLLELWVKGLPFEWKTLYAGRTPKRVPLPAYPFAKERYWLPAGAKAADSSALRAAQLHPLVHENTSTFRQQRFSSTFTGTEAFLKDHLVQGQRVLPGAAYLEMARKAVEEALREDGEESLNVALSHVAWSQPIVQNGEPVRVHVALHTEENGHIRYEIYSSNAPGERIAHSQGYAQWVASKEAPRIDVQALQERCLGAVRSRAECYAAFAEMGLQYGPTHRVLQEVRGGVDADGVHFALARLALPSGTAGDAYVLHPSLLDGALQATIGLNDGDALSLPFALDEVHVFGPRPEDVYAVVRHRGGGEGIRKLDVDLCDAHGIVFVRMHGYSSRARQPVETELSEPRWQRSALAHGSSEALAQATGHWVLVDGAYAQHLPRLKARWPGVHASSLGGNGAGMAARFGAAVESVFAAVGAILRERPQGEVLLQVVLGRDAETLEAVSGILKSARQENPKLVGQVLSLDVDSAEALVARLEENASAREDAEIRYEGTERYTPVLEPLNGTGSEIPWKEGGVYLITGGAGGLGRIFAEEIAKRVANAKVIRTGRSARADVAGYRTLDVSNAEEVRALIQEIVREHGRLDGILHSAGVLEDGYVVKKTAETWRRVLTPKVEGLIHLDEATAELDLDFVVAFSSTAAVFGNAGQSDYAAANGFMDRYMEYRNGLVGEGKRRGKSLSINWPYWENGGMQVDGAILQQYREVYGVAPLDTKQGLLAFYRAMSSGRSRVVVLAHEPRRTSDVPVQRPVESAPPRVETEVDIDLALPDLIERTMGGILSENEFREWLLA